MLDFRRTAATLVMVAFAVPAVAQQSDLWQRMIEGYEAGLRARNLQENARVLEEQRRLLQEQRLATQEERARLQREAANAPPSLSPEQQAETLIAFGEFRAEHPDWKEHELQMLWFGQRLTPKDLTARQYLEILYVLATARLDRPTTTQRAPILPLIVSQPDK